MKKFFYTGIFAIALIVSANADAAQMAAQMDSLTMNTNTGTSAVTEKVDFKCNDMSDPDSNGNCNTGTTVTVRDDIGDYTVIDNGNLVGEGATAVVDWRGTQSSSTTATIDGCPAWMTKSSDGCCCVMK